MNTFVFQSKRVCGYKKRQHMVTYKKYITSTGKERWSYHGYLRVNHKTGAYLKPWKKEFQSNAVAKLDYERQVK